MITEVNIWDFNTSYQLLNSHAPQILTQHLFDWNIKKHKVTLPITMQIMLFFYSPLLIQIYWATYYAGSPTSRSDQITVAMGQWRHVPIAIVISVATGAVTHSSPLILWSNKIQEQKLNIYITIFHQKLVPKAKHIYRQALSI
jgi:hypothetical protein